MTYSFTTLGSPPSAVNFQYTGINSNGQIVGWYSDSSADDFGFLYSGGVYTSLTDPSAQGSPPVVTKAFGINDNGQIVGYYVSLNPLIAQGNNEFGFLYSGGNYTTLPWPSNNPPGSASVAEATGINKAGQIVGWYRPVGGIEHGYLYSGGSYTVLDAPGGTGNTYAEGINNNGQIVGYFVDAYGADHGFLYTISSGKYTVLDDPLASSPGLHANGTHAYGINDSGQVVGWYDAASDLSTNGFLYSGGTFTTLDDPAGNNTEIFGINNAGSIVGNFSGGGFVGSTSSPPLPEVVISPLPNLAGYGTLGTGDFNDDGFSSIVLQNKSNGQMEIWYMANGQIVADYHYGNLSGYAMLGSGDFNGDGTSDIVWQNRSTGQAEIWSMQNGAVIADTPIGNLSGYNLIGTGDFTGSGTSDMVWQNRSTGQAEIWIMSSNHLASDIPIGNLGGYNLIGTADLNGDHQTDLIWQNNASGKVDVWFMGNGHLVADYGYGNLSGYKLLATGDINHDGTTALLWQNELTGEVSDWVISPQTGLPNGNFESFGVQPLNFQETASGHNSDGSPDVLWQDPKTGQTQIWNVSHHVQSGAVPVAAASGVMAASNDTFVFQPDAGAHVANGGSTDTVGLDGISPLANNDQLATLLDEGRIGRSQTLFDSGHDTATNLADHDSITTTRLPVADLHASDFIIH